MVAVSPEQMPAAAERRLGPWAAFAAYFRRNPTVVIGGGLTVAMVLIAIGTLVFLEADDVRRMNPINRLRPPDEGHVFGTDQFGRDVFLRTLYGSQISLMVGFTVAILSTAIGLFIGLVAGYNRIADAVVMRVMDGLMSIPAILLAIALIALTKASVTTVIIAITVPEVPRVVRLVRSVVLSIREMPYVEAAVSVGTPTAMILWRHILPNTIAPLIVQATFVFASAVILEALLGFLGAGTPPEIPSWGNIVAEGRSFFQIAPWIIFFPGLFLSITVLAVNILGDGLRDTLDPRIARRM